MLASLNGQHPLGPEVGLHALKPEHDLLCGFGLLPENWLCLPTVTTLLPIVAPLPLGVQGILALLILGHFVRLMLATFLTESPSGFGYVDHLCSRASTDGNCNLKKVSDIDCEVLTVFKKIIFRNL